MKKPTAKSLQLRKVKLETRLKKYGLDNTVTNIDFFDQSRYEYRTPAEAGERLIILLAVAFTAYNFEQSEKVMDWLKKEQLWKSVSTKEKDFFRDPNPEDEEMQKFSWRFEGAYVLAWSLSKVSLAPHPGSECREEEVKEFLQKVPAIGSSTEVFFQELELRPVAEIVDEGLFYEIARNYFRDLVTRDKENTSQVHSKAALERHLVLHWLRSDAKSLDWDAVT